MQCYDTVVITIGVITFTYDNHRYDKHFFTDMAPLTVASKKMVRTILMPRVLFYSEN